MIKIKGLNGTKFHTPNIFNNPWGTTSLRSSGKSNSVNLEDRFKFYRCRDQGYTFGYEQQTTNTPEDKLHPLMESLDSLLDDSKSFGELEDSLDRLYISEGNQPILTSTPLDKKKLPSPSRNDCYPEDKLLVPGKSPVDIDSGFMTELVDSSTTPNDSSMSPSSCPFSESSLSSSDENTGISGAQITNAEVKEVEVIPIYNDRDAEFWYWSDSEGESSAKDSELDVKPCMDVDKTIFQRTPKRRRKQLRRKQKHLYTGSTTDSEDESVRRKIHRKKVLRRLLTDMKHLQERNLISNNHLNSRAQKRKRWQLRRKEMRRLRQSYCKNEFLSTTMQ